MGSQCHKLHILFFPLMAPGHVLPMIDVAGAFAARGHTATILTTPGNAPLIQQSIELAGEPIQLSCIPFPPVDGLPVGCENLSLVPEDMHDRFFGALAHLRPPFEDALGRLRPDCVVTDTFLPWTADSAAGHGIPRLVLETSNFFVQCAIHSVVKHRPTEHGSDPFVLPGLPHRIEMRKSMMLDVGKSPFFLEMFKQIQESGPKTFGTLINTFYELEPEYAEHYRNVMGRRAWSISPLFLRSTREREKETSSDRHPCLKWLDGRSARSTLYVCFGSLSNVGAAQLREIAAGLEASVRPFVWVVRSPEGEEWMPAGFEERIHGRGLIVRGWAPQIPILNHSAVGGFLTHCGWNSCLEAIAAGLPLITCPLFADQFYNERLVVDVLGIGVAVGMRVHAAKAEDREVAGAAKIERAISALMGAGEAAEERRRRARELGALAARAVERGGSSYNNIDNLVAELSKE